MSLIHDLFFDYTVRTVVLGTLVLGIVSGALGSFAVLRKQSLLGDAIAHAALPGIAVAFMLTYSKSLLVLLTGAIISGILASLVMFLITEYTSLKKDAALGIVLSVFFGFGMVLLTIIQRLPTANKAGLNRFLFGNAATLLEEDVIVMAVFGVVILSILTLFWKEFKLISFNPEFAATLGFPQKRLDIFLTSLIVCSIVIGLQTVGVVLMSAMIIAPAAAARQWTDRLGTMVILAAFFGALAGLVGVMFSSKIDNLPTGPVIVVAISIIVFASLCVAPNRGLLWAWKRSKSNQKQVKEDTFLTNLFYLSEGHDDVTHAHDIQALRAVGGASLDSVIEKLEDRGRIHSTAYKHWGLTLEGHRYVKSLLIGMQT